MKNSRICACWGIQQAAQQNIILAALGQYRKWWNIQTQGNFPNVYLDAGACDLLIFRIDPAFYHRFDKNYFKSVFYENLDETRWIRKASTNHAQLPFQVLGAF